MKPITGTNDAPVIGCGKVTIDEDGVLIIAKLDGNPLCDDLEAKIIEAIQAVATEYVA